MIQEEVIKESQIKMCTAICKLKPAARRQAETWTVQGWKGIRAVSRWWHPFSTHKHLVWVYDPGKLIRPTPQELPSKCVLNARIVVTLLLFQYSNQTTSKRRALPPLLQSSLPLVQLFAERFVAQMIKHTRRCHGFISFIYLIYIGNRRTRASSSKVVVVASPLESLWRVLVVCRVVVPGVCLHCALMTRRPPLLLWWSSPKKFFWRGGECHTV